MNAINKIVLLGDTGVGKSTLVSTLCDMPSRPIKSTIGCSIEVMNYTYNAGTPNECNEVLELWDIGGSSVHRRTAKELFMDEACGIILVHDLSNSKSEENLLSWLNLFYDSNFDRRKLQSQPLMYAADFEHNQHLPTLIIGSHYESYPHRGRNDTKLSKLKSQIKTFVINLNCREKILPGSTEKMIVSKFFDAVVDQGRELEPSGLYGGQQRRRRIGM